MAKAAKAPQDLNVFLASLLEQGIVAGVMTLKFLEEPSKVSYALIPKGGEAFTPVSQELLKKRLEKKTQIIETIKTETNGTGGLLKVFGKCIGCHCCSHVCPICHCKDCFFESAALDYEPLSYSERMKKKELQEWERYRESTTHCPSSS